MSKRQKRWVIIILMIVIFSSRSVVAQEVKRVETNGSIGFTGVYEPIGTPDPTPPESIIRPSITEVLNPSGTLPQTNDNESFKLFWLGILIISYVFLLWNRKNKQTKERK